jgi:mRNA interferase RelE/StbE
MKVPSILKAVVKTAQALRHPSRLRNFEAEDIWQARINKGWRFYFVIQKDLYRIIEMKAHPK